MTIVRPWFAVALVNLVSAVPVCATVVVSPLAASPTRATLVTANSRLPGDTRIFTLTQQGEISVYDRNTNSSSTFLDLTSEVRSGGERGLVGMTFDPDYASNGRFYVFMTVQPLAGGPVYSEVRRFADPLIASEAPRTILRFDTQGTTNHQAGWIDFDQQGKLLIAVGDGGDGTAPDIRNTGQDPTDYFGSILRIDPGSDAFPADDTRNYAIPPGNLAETVPSALPEVYAYGVRNPFRNSIAPDGNLIVADVGQTMQEEVTIVPLLSAMRNLGWALREGNVQTPGVGGPAPADYLAPAFAYDNASPGAAIIGGYVYRGSLVPELYGRYVFGDQVTGDIWSILYTGSDLVDGTLSLIGNVPSISSFGETVDGELILSQYAFRDAWTFQVTSDAIPAVPEPASWLMMIAGFYAAGAVLRRRGASFRATIVPERQDVRLNRHPDGALVSAKG